MKKARIEQTKAPPMAASAIKRTASLPSLLPNTPLMKAPSAGSPKMKATSVKLVAGKILLRISIEGRSVLQQIGFVAANRLGGAVDGESDCEAHGRFSGRHGDHEEGEDLTVVVVLSHAV